MARATWWQALGNAGAVANARRALEQRRREERAVMDRLEARLRHPSAGLQSEAVRTDQRRTV
jgi:hypothetical protein